MTRIGIISFEHMHGLSYATALKKINGVELVGIADEDEYRGSNMASRLNTQYYRTNQELLAQNLDGVIICTNNLKHTETVIEAAEAGTHILVEKPFAINLEHGQQMLAAAKKHQVLIMNALPMRYNPNMIKAKELIDSGEIGTILSVTGINHGKIPSGWFIDEHLSGGGGVMDHTVHIADIIRWLTSSEFSSVYCESGNLIHNKGIDDCGIVMTELENGVFATIDCSWAHHDNYPIWPQVDLEIIGTTGVLNVQAFGQVNHFIDAVQNKIEDIVWNDDGDEGLIQAFVEMCRSGIQQEPSGLDGARATELAVAAYQSSDSRKPVIVKHI